MRRTRPHAFLLALAAAWVSCAIGAIAWAQPGPLNFAPNPSFESGMRGRPAVWRPYKWTGEDATFTWAETGRTGGRSLQITATGTGTDSAWTARVPVDRYGTYRLSGWIKTEDVQTRGGGRGALINIHNLQGVATSAVTGTQDWTEVSVTFDSDANDEVQINCLFGGWGLATGTAWFDDLRVEQIAVKDWKPEVAIDASQTLEPMPVYIYGQFIEHLGRCIYGGIWAEMLEDRKFWYPVTANYNPYGGTRPSATNLFPVLRSSPWRIVGPTNAVTMDRTDSFAGDQTPVVTIGSVPGGIEQTDLGVVQGKHYVGYAWLRAEGEVVATSVLRSGDHRAEVSLGDITGEYAKYPFEFTAGETTDAATLSIIAIGSGKLHIGTVSLMPGDHVEGMRADTLELLKELDSPVYRWPGGNFVSGYDWRDGIGDRDRRPPRKNPAWTGVEHNDFGIDEFMVFCRLLNTEPFIAVNTGLGSVKSAQDEVEYTNGSVDTPMGRLRAENGHPEPYAVKWWAVGNEMYGDWQLGNIPLADYVKRHNEFAEAMWEVDRSIQLIAVGDVGPWSEGMMQHCADHMDLISEHFYTQERPSLSAHVKQVPDAVRHKAEAHRRYRERFDSLEGKDIRIAMDEWNYWYGPHVFGELGTRYFLKDALGIAAGINEYARCADICFMANYAQTVNVIGAIKTTKTEAVLDSTGVVLALYRKQFGTVPVTTTSEWPLDVQAALSEDGSKLTISIVNATMNPIDAPLALAGIELTGKGTRFEIAGDDPQAYNHPGEEMKVRVEETSIEAFGETLSVKPCSITLLVLEIKR